MSKFFRFAPIALILIVLLAVVIPSPALADGGPIVPHDLWADLEEGHQIGVVTILNQDKARIDLFISILDKTAVSHEITFFVPIGVNTADFTALEQDLFTFDKAVTSFLDNALREGAVIKKHAVQALFAGALLTNGAILVPAWAPVLLTGCGAAEQQPESVITTESSQISIYSIDDDTNIDSLIQTTGLPQEVADTLAKLKGQQVAIVKLNTKPDTGETPGNNNFGSPANTEPGLHLSWSTAYIMSGSDKTFVYPLGTGAAWAKPIKLTRVYIQSLPGVGFRVEYPKLGTQHSGFDIIEGSRIQHFFDVPAYAVDEARGDYGRVWRATYTQSNPTEDVIITVKAESGLTRFMAGLEEGAFGYSVLFAFIIGILVWVFAWRLLMPVFLGKGEGVKVPGWWESLLYPAINFAFMIIPGAILWLVFTIGGVGPALVIQFIIGAGVSIGFFALIHGKKFGVSRGKAISAFVLTSLGGSAAYLLLAVGFAFLVNAI